MPILNQKLKKFILLTIDIIGILLVLTVVSFFWRLYYGSINADFLKPYIIHSISSDKIPFSFDIDNVELEWGRGKRLIDITAKQLTIKDQNDAVCAILPKVAIVLNPKNILKGEITPHLIDIVNPSLKVYRSFEKDFQIVIGNETNDNVPRKMTTEELSLLFSGFFDKGTQSEFKQKDLELITISNAELDFTDLTNNNNLNFKDFSFSFSKNRSGILLSSIFNMDFLGQDAFTTFSINFDNKNNETEFGIRFNKFNPAYFSGFFSEFKNIDLPLSGNVSCLIKTDFIKDFFVNQNKQLFFSSRFNKDIIKSLDFDIYSGSGVLALPNPIANKYILYSLFLKGRSKDNLNNLIIENIEADLGTSKASFSGELLDLAEKLKDHKHSLNLKLNAKLDNVTFNDLKKYWPEKIAHHAREWVTSNLTDGHIKSANFDTELLFEQDDINIKKFTGRASVIDTTVNYLHKMPKVFNANGTAYFAKDRIDIDLSKGKSFDLNVTKGHLSFYNLDKDLQKAKINLDIKGSLSDALKVADSDPLNLITLLNLERKEAAGDAKINLDLAFPFIKELKGSDIAVKVKASIENAFISQAFGKHDLSEGKLSLGIDNKSLNLKGNAKIRGLNTRITATEYFTDENDGIKSYKTAGFKLTEEDRKRLKLDLLPFKAPYFKGNLGTEIAITNKYNGDKFLGIRADLTDSSMAFPILGWHKPKQTVANATVSARLLNNDAIDISKFIVSSGDKFDVQGKFLIKPDGSFDKINFSKFLVGRTNAKMIFEKNQDGINIKIAGQSFDFDPIFKDAIGFGSKDDFQLPDMNLHVAVKKMWGSPKGYMLNVGAILKRQKGFWNNLEVSGDFESKEKVLITLLPDNKKGYGLFIETKDAGSLLKTFGILDNIESGYFRLEGYTDSSGKMEGALRVKDYRLMKAPILAQVLTMASLTGFTDILSGGGISFNQMNLPFTYHNGLLEIKEAKTSGNSLGITSQGYIDFKNNNINLEGLVAPAYLISKIIGNIPIIGKLFVGKDDAGVFAVSYNIKGERSNPEIIVNPLSALAPGFLRDLFGNLTKGNEKNE